MSVKLAEEAVELWTRRVEELKARLATLEREVEEAQRVRRDVALSAHTGDEEARAKLEEATQKDISARVEQENVKLALDAALKALENAKQALEEAKKEEARERYRSLCAARRDVARRIDELLPELAKAAARYLEIEGEQNLAARQAGLGLSITDGKRFLGTAVKHALGNMADLDAWDRYPRGKTLVEADPFADPARVPGLGPARKEAARG